MIVYVRMCTHIQQSMSMLLFVLLLLPQIPISTAFTSTYRT